MAKKKSMWINIVFVAVCVGIVGFLLSAPEKSTSRLPQDANHKKFYSMGKKEAEKSCLECHSDTGMVPFPENHPAKFRCLFCHTKAE